MHWKSNWVSRCKRNYAGWFTRQSKRCLDFSSCLLLHHDAFDLVFNQPKRVDFLSSKNIWGKEHSIVLFISLRTFGWGKANSLLFERSWVLSDQPQLVLVDQRKICLHWCVWCIRRQAEKISTTSRQPHPFPSALRTVRSTAHKSICKPNKRLPCLVCSSLVDTRTRTPTRTPTRIRWHRASVQWHRMVTDTDRIIHSLIIILIRERRPVESQIVFSVRYQKRKLYCVCSSPLRICCQTNWINWSIPHWTRFRCIQVERNWRVSLSLGNIESCHRIRSSLRTARRTERRRIRRGCRERFRCRSLRPLGSWTSVRSLPLAFRCRSSSTSIGSIRVTLFSADESSSTMLENVRRIGRVDSPGEILSKFLFFSNKRRRTFDISPSDDSNRRCRRPDNATRRRSSRWEINARCRSDDADRRRCRFVSSGRERADFHVRCPTIVRDTNRNLSASNRPKRNVVCNGKISADIRFGEWDRSSCSSSHCAQREVN